MISDNSKIKIEIYKTGNNIRIMFLSRKLKSCDRQHVNFVKA